MEIILKDTNCKKIEYKANPVVYTGYGSNYISDEDKKLIEFLTLCLQDKQDEAIKFYEDNKLSASKYVKFDVNEERKKLNDTNTEVENKNKTSYTNFSFRYEAVIFKLIQIGSDKVFEHIMKIGKYIYVQNERGLRSYLSYNNNLNLINCVGTYYINNPTNKRYQNILNSAVNHLDTIDIKSSSYNSESFLNIITQYKDVKYEYVKTFIDNIKDESYITNRNYVKHTSALLNVIQNNREDLIKLFLNNITSLSQDEYDKLSEDMKKYADRQAIVITQIRVNKSTGANNYAY